MKITPEKLALAAALLEDLRQFMTAEVAVKVPWEALTTAVKTLEALGAIRVFSQNVGYEVGTCFALAEPNCPPVERLERAGVLLQSFLKCGMTAERGVEVPDDSNARALILLRACGAIRLVYVHAGADCLQEWAILEDRDDV